MKRKAVDALWIHSSVDPWLESVQTEEVKRTETIVWRESARKEVERVMKSKKYDERDDHERTVEADAREEEVAQEEQPSLPVEEVVGDEVVTAGGFTEDDVRSADEVESMEERDDATVVDEETSDGTDSVEAPQETVHESSVEEERSLATVYEDRCEHGVQTMRRFETLYVGLDVALESLTHEAQTATDGVVEQLGKVREVLLMQWQVVTQLEDDAVQRLVETIAEPTEDDVASVTEAAERMDAMWETLVETALQMVNTLDLMIDNYERVEGQEEMTGRLEQFATIWVETLATSRIVERPVIGEPFEGEWMASFGVDDRPVEEDVEPYTVTRAVRRAFFDEETSDVVQDAHVYTSAE